MTQQARNRGHMFLLWMLFFLASVVYNILLPLKKTIVMYIPGAGTESMAYLKPCFITPGALLLTGLHLKLSQKIRPMGVVRVMLGLFVGYFALYTFVLHPAAQFFALAEIGQILQSILPAQFHAAPPLFAYWMDTLFYTMAELWGPAIVSLLIWGAVNQQFSEQKAQASYAFLTIGVNLSAMFAGWVSGTLSRKPLSIAAAYSPEKWEQSFYSVMLVVLIAAAGTWIIYEVLYASRGFNIVEEADRRAKKSDKPTYSLLASIRMISQQPRLWAIAVIVVVYNIVYTVSDFVFVKQVELFYGPEHKALSNACLSQVSYYTGLVALVLAIVVYPLSMRQGGWLWTALITPVLFGATAMLFYGTQALPAELFGSAILQSSLSWPLIFGLIHICFLRGSRYSLFDATKEIAYIGLPHEQQIQGKALIDGIASRLGKSGGSMLFFFCYAFLGNSIVAAIPTLFILMIIITLYWIYAVATLARLKSASELRDKEVVLRSEEALVTTS